MPVCKHASCYEHVVERDTFCAKHSKPAPKKSTKDTKTPSPKQFKFILNNCLRTANKAMAAVTPTPMVVTEHSDPLDDRSSIVRQDYVASGACGYVGLYLPKNFAFTKWLVANHYAYDFGSFVSLETPKTTQSYEQLRAWSHAFRRMLEHEYPAYAKRVRYEYRLT